MFHIIVKFLQLFCFKHVVKMAKYNLEFQLRRYFRGYLWLVLNPV